MNTAEASRKSHYIYVIFILIQSLIYGIGNPLTKVAYESITPLWLLATRFTLSFAILFLLFGKTIVSDVKKTSWKLWLPSSLCCAGAYMSCNLALNLTSATNVGFIMSLPLIFAPILAVFVLKEAYVMRKLPLQILALIGLFMLCCDGGSFSFGLGEALALFDAFCLAGVLVFGERAMREMNVISVTALQAGMAMIASLIAAFLFDDVSALSAVTPGAWLVVLYLAIVCTIGGYFLQNVAVSHLSASSVSMLQCTQPILTAAVSFFLLHETLGAIGLAGGAIIIVTLIMESRIR